MRANDNNRQATLGSHPTSSFAVNNPHGREEVCIGLDRASEYGHMLTDVQQLKRDLTRS